LRISLPERAVRVKIPRRRRRAAHSMRPGASGAMH
jgi:hypothetical protein